MPPVSPPPRPAAAAVPRAPQPRTRLANKPRRPASRPPSFWARFYSECAEDIFMFHEPARQGSPSRVPTRMTSARCRDLCLHGKLWGPWAERRDAERGFQHQQVMEREEQGALKHQAAAKSRCGAARRGRQDSEHPRAPTEVACHNEASRRHYPPDQPKHRATRSTQRAAAGSLSLPRGRFSHGTTHVDSDVTSRGIVIFANTQSL